MGSVQTMHKFQRRKLELLVQMKEEYPPPSEKFSILKNGGDPNLPPSPRNNWISNEIHFVIVLLTLNKSEH